MPKPRSLLALGAGLLVALALVGCGGDDNSSAASAAGNGGAGTRVNFAESAAKLDTLESFRFSGSASFKFDGAPPSSAEDAFGAALIKGLLDGLKDVKVEGAVVAPDQAQVSFKFGSQEFGLVQIKDQAWVKFMGGWTSIDPEDLGLSDGFDFSDLAADQLPQDVVQAAKVSTEKVNGINATKYSFDKAALQSLADVDQDADNIDTADMAVWLTDDGVPVKFTMKLKGKGDDGGNIEMQAEFSLSDLNENISIKAPK